ncbi:MAG: hypothetical protein FWD36_03855 [Treponema sp.]|nr:hypothetical protein [Treponema sp.]
MKNMALASIVLLLLVTACESPFWDNDKEPIIENNTIITGSEPGSGNNPPASFNITIDYEPDAGLTPGELTGVSVNAPATATAGESVSFTVSYSSLELAVQSLTLREGDANGPIIAWERNAAGSAYTFIMPESDVHGTIVFMRKNVEHNITIVRPADGYITAMPADKAQAGMQVVLLAEPRDNHYEYVGGSLMVISASGPIATQETALPNGIYYITFDMPAEDVRVRGAEFELYKPNVIYYAIERSPSIPFGGGTVTVKRRAEAGTVVTLTVSLWTGNGLGAVTVTRNSNGFLEHLTPVDVINPFSWTFIMPSEPVTVTAQWQSLSTYTYTVTNANATPTAGGSLSVSPLGRQNPGTPITIELHQTPNQALHYEFDTISLMLGGSPVQAIQQGQDLAWTYTLPADTLTQDVPLIVSATVKQRPWYTVVNANVIPIDGIAGGILSVSPVGRQEVGTPITITFVQFENQALNYEFESINLMLGAVNVSGQVQGQRPVWTYTLPAGTTSGNTDLTISATVTQRSWYTVVNANIAPIDGIAGGSLTVSPVGSRLEPGTPVTITLEQNPDQAENYEFESITLMLGGMNVTGAANQTGTSPLTWTYTLPASAPPGNTDLTISATVTQKSWYTVINANVTPYAGGTLTVSPVGRQDPGTEVTITFNQTPSQVDDYEFGAILIMLGGTNVTGAADQTGTSPLRWTYTLPTDASTGNTLTISATVRQKNAGGPVYTVVNNGINIAAAGSLLVSPIGNQNPGTAIVMRLNQTISQSLEYELVSFNLMLGVTDVSLEAARSGNEWIYTLPATDPAADTNLTASVTLRERPTYTVTLPAAMVDGAITLNMNAGVTLVSPNVYRVGSNLPVTVTIFGLDAMEYRYREGTFSLTRQGGGDVIPSRGPSYGQVHSWTFDMPEANVVVDATVELLPRHFVNRGSMTNGTIVSINGSTDFPVLCKEDFPVIMVIKPNRGYKVGVGSLTPTPAQHALNLGETATINTWSFIMGMDAANMTVNLNCVPSGGKPIYANGNFVHQEFLPGRTISLHPLNNNFNFAANLGFVDMNAEMQGPLLNDNTRAIRVHVPSTNGGGAEIGFSLQLDAAANLGDVSALSFWAKKHDIEGTRNIQLVGFGGHPADSRESTVHYYGEGNTDNENELPATWRRYIVPVPVPQNPYNIRCVFNLKLTLEPGHTVFIDEIEFLPFGDVVLRDIRLPAIMPGNIKYNENSNAIDMIQLERDGLSFIYSTRSGLLPPAFASLYSKARSNLSENDYRLLSWIPESQLIFNNASNSNATVSGRTVTPVIPGSQFHLGLTYNGISSSRNMLVQIQSDSVRTIEDFVVNSLGGWLSDFANNPGDSRFARYWVTGMHGDPGGGGGGCWITTGEESGVSPRPGGNLRQLVLAPAVSGALGGRQLPAAVDIAQCTNVTISFARLSTLDTYALVLYTGAAWTSGDAEPTYAQRAEVNFTPSAAAMAWGTVPIPVASFTAATPGFNLSAVNGWAIKVVTKNTDTTTDSNRARIFINAIEAE